jgi:hypothetical protein
MSIENPGTSNAQEDPLLAFAITHEGSVPSKDPYAEFERSASFEASTAVSLSALSQPSTLHTLVIVPDGGETFEGAIVGVLKDWRIEVEVELLEDHLAVNLVITVLHQEENLAIGPFNAWMWYHTGENGVHEYLALASSKVPAGYQVADGELEMVEKEILRLVGIHPLILKKRRGLHLGGKDQGGYQPTSLDPGTLYSRRVLSSLDRGQMPFASEMGLSITADQTTRKDGLYQGSRYRMPSSCADNAFYRSGNLHARFRFLFAGWRVYVKVWPTDRLDIFSLDIELEHYANHFVAFSAWQGLNEANDICVSLWMEAHSHPLFKDQKYALEVAYAIRKAVAPHLLQPGGM